MPQGGGALLLLLSTDGEFVRGILLDEVGRQWMRWLKQRCVCHCITYCKGGWSFACE